MKIKELKYLPLIVLLFCIQFLGFSQNSASANFTASVTIVEPIEIRTVSDMNFASIDASEGGAVILTPDNTRLVEGNIVLDEANGQTPAIFEVKGHNQYSYHIAVPEQAYLVADNAEPIIIKDFNAVADSQTFNKDSQTIRLGATLEVQPGQTPGNYRSASPLEITVSYN